MTTNILKIVLFGPESTGKTTLAKKLSTYYKAAWNPEFLRYYINAREATKDNKESKQKITIEKKELQYIALGQLASELAIEEHNVGFVILDTCLHTNLIYAEHYYKKAPDIIHKLLEKRKYDIFLLCHTDLSWEDDPQRDSPEVREKLFLKMHNYLIKNQLPFAEVTGSGEKRFKNVVDILSSKFPILNNSNQ